MENAHISSVDMEEFEGSGTKLWVGKDYCNFIYKDFVDLDKPFTGNTSPVLSILFLFVVICPSDAE